MVDFCAVTSEFNIGNDIHPVVSFFKTNLSDILSQDSSDRFSLRFHQSPIHHTVGIWSQITDLTLFFRSLKRIAMTTNFSVKTETDCSIALLMWKVYLRWFGYIVYKFSERWPVTPGFRGFHRTPFVDQQFGYVCLAEPLVDLAGISAEFSGDDHYSDMLHLYARGRYCYAAPATR